MFKKSSSNFGSKDTDRDNSTSQEQETKELDRIAQGELADFHRTIDVAANELDFMPAESQSAAAQLVDACKSELSELEKEWNEVCQQQPASEETLRAFTTRIKIAKGKLSPFKQRKMHRRSLSVLEKQLAQQESALTKVTKEGLETALRPQIDAQLEGISTLEEKNQLDDNEQRRLAIYQSNLKICQEMLSGQRPYAPLYIINEKIKKEQAIQDIDNQIIGK